MKWDKVYAQAGVRQVETEEGPILDVMSFRMIAEINNKAYLATHVVLLGDYQDAQFNLFGKILDDMVRFIDTQAGLVGAVDEIFED